jgi:hypothetical protein
VLRIFEGVMSAPGSFLLPLLVAMGLLLPLLVAMGLPAVLGTLDVVIGLEKLRENARDVAVLSEAFDALLGTRDIGAPHDGSSFSLLDMLRPSSST